MITVKDFLEKITNPDRIKIVKGKEVIFAGYKGALVHEGAADLSPDILPYGPDRTGTGAGL